MKAICGFMNTSQSTILTLIRREAFPAKKIQGTWYSDSVEISRWVRGQVGVSTNKLPEKPLDTTKYQ
jgi:hypothetical protein